MLVIIFTLGASIAICKRRRIKSMQALISRQDHMMRAFLRALRDATAEQRKDREHRFMAAEANDTSNRADAKVNKVKIHNHFIFTICFQEVNSICDPTWVCR